MYLLNRDNQVIRAEQVDIQPPDGLQRRGPSEQMSGSMPPHEDHPYRVHPTRFVNGFFRVVIVTMQVTVGNLMERLHQRRMAAPARQITARLSQWSDCGYAYLPAITNRCAT
jgi:hypothetical protein